MRRDRPQTLDRVEKGIERLKQKQEWYKAKMNQAAPTMDALKLRRAAAKQSRIIKAEIKAATLPFSPLHKEAIARGKAATLSSVSPALDKSFRDFRVRENFSYAVATVTDHASRYAVRCACHGL